MIKKLIRCAACNQVVPNYDGFELARAKSLAGVEWSNADLVRGKDFLISHPGHPLEELMIDGETRISERPFHEPIRATYFLASNGDRKFLIRRTKTALDRPVSYEVVPGKLQISNVALLIQEDDLRKEIASDPELSALPQEKVQKFIEAFRAEAAAIAMEDLVDEIEAIEEGETSLLAFGSLKGSCWERILGRCRRDFGEAELGALRRFIDENRESYDVLALRIQRRISTISLVAAEPALGLQENKEVGPAMEAAPAASAEKEIAKGRA
jgi:hypothetical protein